MAPSPPLLLIPARVLSAATSSNVGSLLATLWLILQQHVLARKANAQRRTSDSVKVVTSDWPSSVEVDQLAAEGAGVWCDGVWSRAPPEPRVHQMLSIHPAFMSVPGDLLEQWCKITLGHKRKM